MCSSPLATRKKVSFAFGKRALFTRCGKNRSLLAIVFAIFDSRFDKHTKSAYDISCEISTSNVSLALRNKGEDDEKI